MPLVSEFNREEFSRRYSGTFIKHLGVPVYVSHVHRTGTRGIVAECIAAENYSLRDIRDDVLLNDTDTDLTLPDLGYVMENDRSGYVSRNISRSYKRGLDLGTVSYRSADGMFNTLTGKTVVQLYQSEFGYKLEDVLNETVKSKKEYFAHPLNKEWALYKSRVFTEPLIGYHGYTVGLFNTNTGVVVLKKALDWLPEVFPSQFKNLGVELR
jgi:hypothetical protein